MVHKDAKIGPGTMIWHRELSNIGAITCGTGCVFHSHIWIADGVMIGDRVKIQAFSFIPEGVILADDVFIGPHVCFTNDKFPPSNRIHWAPTLVKQGAVIGANATILPGITIGARAVIGAGAIVTKDVEDGAIVFNDTRAVRKGTRK